MDRIKLRAMISERFAKNKYVLLVIIIGIILMSLPEFDKESADQPEIIDDQSEETIERRLEEILYQIQGVGKVKVLITEKTGSETVYQKDVDRTEGEDDLRIKEEVVIISGNSIQSGLVQTVTPPTYLGAIVVCQGAGSPAVRLAVTNAVSAVTGISMDRITVLEMK